MLGSKNILQNGPQDGQCHNFVMRKKRFCRMTVRPGRQYCGEHEPKPKTEDGQDDTRIPCPLDPKHTCYASKLEKHLSICNAKQTEVPSYIIHNINAPLSVDSCPKKPLNEVPMEYLEKVIEKINFLFAEHISEQVSTLLPPPIHASVAAEFAEAHRGETSLRHLRQVSSLLHIAERERLVQHSTCYVELGAGKGHLSYYLGVSWCRGTGSRVLSIDRAALRHKRDNLLRSERRNHDRNVQLDNQAKTVQLDNQGKTVQLDNQANNDQLDNQARKTNDGADGKSEEDAAGVSVELVAVRIRADLAHLALERVPVVRECERVVGFAKHLCGVAMDYALRCVAAAGCAGAVLATCCHHRCTPPSYVATSKLQDLGITSADFNVILSITSWATSGDGRSRDLRKINQQVEDRKMTNQLENVDDRGSTGALEPQEESSEQNKHISVEDSGHSGDKDTVQITNSVDLKDQSVRAQIGRKAKLLLDWGRVLYLRDQGFDARLCYYVPTTVSLENICIVVKKM